LPEYGNFHFCLLRLKKGIKRENFQEEIPEMGFFRKKKHQYHFGGDRIISFGKDLINFREDKILFQLKKNKIDLK